jgi:hypothetical protein
MSILPKNYKYSGAKNITLYPLKLSETHYNRKQLLSEMKTYKEFMERFNCSVDELCEILDKCGIQDNSLFEYTTCAFNDYYPIAKDYIFTSNFVNKCGSWKEEKTYYDIYLCHNQYSSLALNVVAEELIKRRFPFLSLPPFTKIEKRFKDNIKELPSTINAKVKDIDSSILFDNNLTIGDLIKLYTDDSFADSDIEKPLYNVYADGSVYIEIDESKGGWSVGTTFAELLNKDWKAIEERKVFSICLYDENGEQIKGKWFNGKQKDAPYFNDPLVKELKKYFLT